MKRKSLIVISIVLMVAGLIMFNRATTKPIGMFAGPAMAATPTQAPALAQYLGVYAIRQTTSMCSTSGTLGSVCSEPTITIPDAFVAAGTYVVVATCVGGVTGVPIVQEVTEAVASSKIQVVVEQMTASVTASCTEVDIMITSPTVAAS